MKLLPLILLLAGCTFASHRNGETRVWTGANLASLDVKSKGFEFHLRQHDPAATYNGVGTAISKVAITAGGAAFRP